MAVLYHNIEIICNVINIFFHFHLSAQVSTSIRSITLIPAIIIQLKSNYLLYSCDNQTQIHHDWDVCLLISDLSEWLIDY